MIKNFIVASALAVASLFGMNTDAEASTVSFVRQKVKIVSPVSNFVTTRGFFVNRGFVNRKVFVNRRVFVNNFHVNRVVFRDKFGRVFIRNSAGYLLHNNVFVRDAFGRILLVDRSGNLFIRNRSINKFYGVQSRFARIGHINSYNSFYGFNNFNKFNKSRSFGSGY